MNQDSILITDFTLELGGPQKASSGPLLLIIVSGRGCREAGNAAERGMSKENSDLLGENRHPCARIDISARSGRGSRLSAGRSLFQAATPLLRPFFSITPWPLMARCSRLDGPPVISRTGKTLRCPSRPKPPAGGKVFAFILPFYLYPSVPSRLRWRRQSSRSHFR